MPIVSLYKFNELRAELRESINKARSGTKTSAGRSDWYVITESDVCTHGTSQYVRKTVFFDTKEVFFPPNSTKAKLLVRWYFKTNRGMESSLRGALPLDAQIWYQE